MKCDKCGAKIEESYTDFQAAYIGYGERYINCWICKTVTVLRYEFVKVVACYPMVRNEENKEKEKCYHENKKLKIQ